MNTPPAIWITGADGFAGTWLRRCLVEDCTPWAGFVHPNGLEDMPKGTSIGVDLQELAENPAAASNIPFELLPPPAGVIHLAAISFAPLCEEQPAFARAINVQGPKNLYEEILKRWPDCPILHISTSHVYLPANHHLTENQKLEPVNVYGASKLDGEKVALGFRDRGHKVTVVRPFNHTGPGQNPAFALPSFAMRLAALEKQGGGTLEVGRLDAVRDFLHVREVVSYYRQLLPKAGQVDIVNLCSGIGHSMEGLLNSLLQHFDCPIEVVEAGERLRGEADANQLVGDTSRLQQLLGCTPSLDLTQLSAELVSDARKRVANGEDLSRA